MDSAGYQKKLLESGLFKDLQSSLDFSINNDADEEQSKTKGVLDLLDRYSSVLVDLISSKLKDGELEKPL